MSSDSGVRNGLLLGISLTLLSFGCYFIDPKYMFYVTDYFGYIIAFCFMVKSILDEKKLQGGILSFKEAIRPGFVTYIIGTFFGVIFLYIMLNLYDSTLYEVMKEVAVQRVEFFSELFLGAEPNQAKDLSVQLDQQDVKLSFPSLFFKYLQRLIFPGFMFAALIAAVLKKEDQTS